MCNRTLLKSLILVMFFAPLIWAQDDKTVGDPTPPAPTTEATQEAAVGVAGEATPSISPWRMYPDTQSVFAQFVDNVNNFINIVSMVSFIGIIVFMVYFAVKFRRRDPHQKALSQVSHNTALELSWTIPPLILVFIMFYYGFVGFLELNTPPDNAYTVQVTAQKWAWSFKHPNGRIDAADPDDRSIPAILHVPAGEPIVFQLESTDVLHSMGVPAWRIKKDAVPGRYTYMWVEAIDPTPNYYDQHAEVIEPNDPDREQKERDKKDKLRAAARGGHILFCSEFCGTQHSDMLARVVVHPRGWRPAAEPMPTEKIPKGKYLFNKVYVCNSCHTSDPKQQALPTAPRLDGVFGHEVKLLGGGSVVADEAYIRESILTPNAKIVEGYQPGLMPPTFGTMPEDHLEAIIAFLKSIGRGEGGGEGEGNKKDGGQE